MSKTTSSYYYVTKEDLEVNADLCKVTILRELVAEGLMDEKIADKWCAAHTVILRKKNLFRTISKLFKKEEESEGLLYIVVKQRLYKENLK